MCMTDSIYRLLKRLRYGQFFIIYAATNTNYLPTKNALSETSFFILICRLECQ